MIGVTKIANAGVALNYYSERDDYYREGGGAPAAFVGRGAAELGLSGDMTSRKQAQAFADLLANGGGRKGGIAAKHTPGWDVTFSAPKSASVAALVGGDDRLVAAHERAVARALAHIEQHAIVTRQRGTDGKGYEWRHGTGLIAATFRHATSREVDPQLHTHTVIVNATRDPATWELRALDSRELYRAQSEAGAIYTTELAAQCRALGYAVDFRIDANGHPQFELADVPPAIREQFSKRSAAIDTALAAVDKDRATASPAAKQAAAMATRAAKEHVDHATLRGRWQEEARSRDWEPTQRPLTLPPEQDPAKVAAAAVRQAAEHLAERDARFSARALEHEARLFAESRANDDQIRAAIAMLSEKGELQHRDVQERAAGGRRESATGFTTRTGVELEKKMLSTAQNLSDRRVCVCPRNATSWHRQRFAQDAIANQERISGRAFTIEQRAATTAILTDHTQLHILHGHAGTAKTSSVLACVRNSAEIQGFHVRALAPTNDAAQKLGDSIHSRHATVASHLAHEPRREVGPTGEYKREMWIVDEAGMLSAKDMKALLQKAEQTGATVVLAGDTKQLGSVEAGAALEQLRDTFGSVDLTDIKRQKNEQLREAVYDALRGDAKAALSKVPTVEIKDRDGRVAEITRLYMERSPEQRKETLVLAPGKDDRAQINEAIREARRDRGELGRETTVDTLQKSDLTRAERKQAGRYQPGMVIEASRSFSLGPMKGERGEVVGVEKGKVAVAYASGQVWRFDPRKTTAIEVYEGRRDLRVAEGDKLVAKGAIEANEANGNKPTTIKNGTQLDVVKVRDDAIIVRNRDGMEYAIGRNAQLDYAYAQTVHQAQGQDYAHILVHAESKRENLQTLATLYVMISRARESGVIVSDDIKKLVETLERNVGANAVALLRDGEQVTTAPYQLGHLAQYQADQQAHATPPAMPSTPALEQAPPEPQPQHEPTPAPTPDRDRDDGPSWS